jgi:hypothetical protein
MSTQSLVAIIAMLAGCANAVERELPADAMADSPIVPGDPPDPAVLAADVSMWDQPLAQSQMDCFWDTGVRHVVVGTQDLIVARQQLAMAVSRGMTVDAYVHLYWDVDLASQIDAAFAVVQDFPIGRLWLHVEDDPNGLGPSALVARIQEARTACETKALGRCGIYTSPGWWQAYLADTTMFGDLPLWYVLHNNKRSLADWPTEHFGGWVRPAGKQFQTTPLCGAGGADWDVVQVATTPSVVVDRSLPPDTGFPPVVPDNLFPQDAQVIPIDYLKLMSGAVPRATSYQLALEHYDGASWTPYYTWTNSDAYVTVSPPATPALYRLRARAENTHGWGDWSDYVSFDYGTYTGRRPGDPPPPPPPPDVPASLSPDGGVTITTASVTLTCSAITGATAYDFAIESYDGTTWAPYFTYTTTGPARAFYPQFAGRDYRFKVRALIAGSYHAWSSYATFHMQ